jgi:hypothetical protein
MMLSSKLVRLIESHSEKITADAVQRMRKDPELSHFKKLPDSELRSWARHILQHLGDWLALSDDQQIASCYEGVGKMRFDEAVPLAESVRSFQTLKDLIVAYVRNQANRQTALEIYAEEELEHLLSRFFDRVIYHVVKGYERARRYDQAAAS